MLQLPAFINENKKLSIVLLIVIIIIIALFIFSKIDFSPSQESNEITNIPEAEVIAELKPISTEDRRGAVETILEFFDKTLGDNGLYNSSLECTVNDDQQVTANDCRSLNSNPLAGLALIWGRNQALRAFDNPIDQAILQEDLNAYYLAFITNATDSAVLTLDNTNIPVCTYLKDVAQNQALSEDSKARADYLCANSNYASPSAQLTSNDTDYIISDTALNDWLNYLTENTLKGNTEMVLNHLPDFTDSLERKKRDIEGISFGMQCKTTALANLLGAGHSSDEKLMDLWDSYGQINTSDIENIASDDLQTLSSCSLALPNLHLNRDSAILLQNKIYNAWQNQQSALNAPVAPAPFVSEAFNNGSSWVIDVAQNGLLIGGLSQYN
jgi:hypothetical protein